MLNRKTIEDLAAAADGAISRSLLWGPPAMVRQPRIEVDMLAAVTLFGIEDVYDAWSPILAAAGYSLEMHGVFCHGRPVVIPSTGRPCELADLLLVTDTFLPDGWARSATLIQAKMASRAARVDLSGESSVKQLYLYSNWPPFTFDDQASYGPTQYSLQKPASDDAGTIGVIDRHFKNSPSSAPRWTQHSPIPEPEIISADDLSLGWYMAEMAAQTDGYGRVCYGSQEDWSRLIELLLRVTYNRAFSHRPSLGSRSFQRGVSVRPVSPDEVAEGRARLYRRTAARQMFSGKQPPVDHLPGLPEGTGRGGISVVHTILASMDKRDG